MKKTPLQGNRTGQTDLPDRTIEIADRVDYGPGLMSS
jgi:hypothetical protein